MPLAHAHTAPRNNVPIGTVRGTYIHSYLGRNHISCCRLCVRTARTTVMSSAPTVPSAASDCRYNLRVFLRIRPSLPREASDDNILNIGQPCSDGGQTVTITPHESKSDGRRDRRGAQSFGFDGVFGPTASQSEVFIKAVCACNALSLPLSRLMPDSTSCCYLLCRSNRRLPPACKASTAPCSAMVLVEPESRTLRMGPRARVPPTHHSGQLHRMLE